MDAQLAPAPAVEYCLLWINWWPLCMTKAEWSGWVQAIGSVAAIFASAVLVLVQHRHSALAAQIAEFKAAASKLLALQHILSDAHTQLIAVEADFLKAQQPSLELFTAATNAVTIVRDSDRAEVMPQLRSAFMGGQQGAADAHAALTRIYAFKVHSTNTNLGWDQIKVELGVAQLASAVETFKTHVRALDDFADDLRAEQKKWWRAALPN